MYFGECAVSNQIDLVLYENDNIISMLHECFDGTDYLTEANLKEIGKSVWDAIKRILRTIKTAFDNLIMNVNYFKNAEMDEQHNKDLLEVLKIISLKTLDEGAQFLPSFFRIMAKYKPDETSGDIDSRAFGNLLGGVSDFEFEITKHVTDIDESIKDGKESKAYKNLENNEYKNDKMTKVPLSNIIPDMKDSNSKLTKFINQLEVHQKFDNKITEENKEIKSLSGKVITYLRKLVEYFKFRISLLQNYFKAAKASIEAVKNNIKELKNKENTTDHKMSTSSMRAKMAKVKDIPAFNEVRKELKEANSELDMNRYKEAFKKFAEMLGCKNTDTIVLKQFDEDTGAATINVVGNKYEKVALSGSRKMYHHAYCLDGSPVDQNIVQKGLIPNALGNKSGGQGILYYPEPRVYLHLMIPKTASDNKAGGDLGGLFGNTPLKDIKPSMFQFGGKGCVYEIEGHYDVYRDPEYKGTAAFIISDKPVKVKKVDMEKWYKDHKVD